jgi:hypothetical protein
VVSSLDDLRTWIHALADGTVLDADHVEDLFVPGTEISSPRGRYALGWFVQQTPRHGRLIHHGGDYLGCGADLEWYRDAGVVIASSTNVRHDVYPTRNCMQSLVPDLLFGDAPAPEIPAFEELDAEPPDGLAGTYALAPHALLHVERLRGRTYLWAEGQAATDLLAPATEAIRADRAWRSNAAQLAFDGILTGKPEALDALLGASPNPRFRPGLIADVTAPGKGKLESVMVLGSYATGYPHGSPPGNEATLLRLQYTEGSRIYAIRWSGREIAWTEMVTYPGAAPIPLQRAANGSWVGWQLVDRHAVTVRPARRRRRTRHRGALRRPHRAGAPQLTLSCRRSTWCAGSSRAPGAPHRSARGRTRAPPRPRPGSRCCRRTRARCCRCRGRPRPW